MNYIKQLNELYTTLDYKPLTAEAIAVYFVLLQIANKTGWITEFKVANTVLMSKCNISIDILKTARNKLKTQGYIDYTKGKNQNDAPKYKIIKLYTTQAEPQAETQPQPQAPTQPLPHINKQNKTKQNKKDSSSVKNNLYNPEVVKIQEIMIETIGTTNINNITECINYLDKLPIELIEYALRKTARIERPSWQYAIPILEGYISKGFRTIKEVKADDLKYKNRANTMKQAEKNKTEPKVEYEEVEYENEEDYKKKILEKG